MRSRFGSLLVFVGAVGFLGNSAHAELTAYDPFPIAATDLPTNYEAGETIRGKQPPALGFSNSAWDGNSGNFLASSGDLGTVDATGKINMVGVAGDTSLTRSVARGLTAQSSSTFYMGSLVNTGTYNAANGSDAPVNPGSFAVTGFVNATGGITSPDGGNLFGLTWGVGGNETGNAFDLILRDRHNPAGTGAVGSDITVANRTLLADAQAQTTYLLLFKFERATTPDAGAGNDSVTYWVGDPNTFDGSTETMADATAITRGQLGSYGFNTDADLAFGAFAQNSNENGAIFFDNLALGTDITTVNAAINPVPEPSSLGLLGLGMGLLLSGQRKSAQ